MMLIARHALKVFKLLNDFESFKQMKSESYVPIAQIWQSKDHQNENLKLSLLNLSVMSVNKKQMFWIAISVKIHIMSNVSMRTFSQSDNYCAETVIMNLLKIRLLNSLNLHIIKMKKYLSLNAKKRARWKCSNLWKVTNF